MASTFTLTPNAVEWITGDCRWNTWKEWVTETLGEYADSYDIEEVAKRIASAYGALLPAPMVMAENFIYIEAEHGLDLDQVRQEVRQAAADLDVWAIIRECELPG